MEYNCSVAREIESARYRKRLTCERGARDRSRARAAPTKSRLRNEYRKVEITLNSNTQCWWPRIGRARDIYRRWWRLPFHSHPPPSRGWLSSPRAQAGNSKVETATMGEAKSVRVMGHRHAISPTPSLPTHLLPLSRRVSSRAILTFNFARGSPPDSLSRRSVGASHPTAWQGVARCDLSALIIRRQESGQADDQTCHPRKVAFLRRIAPTPYLPSPSPRATCYLFARGPP